MKVSRRHGQLRMQLAPHEAELLSMLFDDLEAVLDGAAGADDEVVRRLSPAAYRDDADAEAEYRSLTQDSLRAQRTDRMAACRADLAADPGSVDLGDPDAARRWIQVLNDLRLALGTRLGISEDDDREARPADPARMAREMYNWLTTVQELVVRGLM